MPDVADENASLEDSRTTLVDTIERSTPESEADRSNIFETRYWRGHAQKKHGSAQLVRKSSMPLSRLESFKGQYPYELSSGGEVARFGSVWPYEQPLVETPPNKKPAL